MLAMLFGSRLRAEILGCLFTHPGERYYIRQLARMLQADSTNMSRELSRLEKAGLLSLTVEGKQKYCQSNQASPVFGELRDFIIRAGATAPQRFPVTQQRMAQFCRKHHIKKLALFGSVLREDFRPESDIDVLVEFAPGYVPGFAMVELENELSRLAGRKVDLRTLGDLSRYFRDNVIREARVQYADTRP